MNFQNQDNDPERFKKLKTYADDFPRLPGVYIMRSSDKEVIYVGKARDLKARIKSYFLGGDGRQQIEFLMRRVDALEHIVTENEEQALILERDLINKYKPRYNIRLKDDKSYLSVRIDQSSKWPRIELVRKVEQDGATYFGPYTDGNKLRNTLQVIKNVVPLRTCTNTIFYNRQRPCLEYQIKRCAGPCCLPVEEKDYEQWVQQAINILKGKNEEIVDELEARMNDASDNLRFEEAAIVRDRLQILEEYSSGEKYIQHYAESRDVFAFYREAANVCVSVMKVRNGRIGDSENFSFNDVQVSDDEVLEAVLSQYYGTGSVSQKVIPEEIIIPIELANLSILEKNLREKREGSFTFTIPQRGSKLRLLNLARLNAEQNYASRFNAEERYVKISEELALKFKLKQIPRRIECVDISNFQGSDIVGALVSFFDGVPDKKSYRRYKLSIKGKPDDFASVHEVVSRRLKRGQEEDDLPDLLIIDGGPGQLSKALEARDKLNVKLEIISIAKMRTESDFNSSEISKKPERVYIESEADPIALSESEGVTHFLQRIRDENHRFVITFHRERRSKRVFKSVLDDILGVGPERRTRLLKHFGSVNRIKYAEVKEIARVGRMPLSLAEKIKKTLESS